MPSRVHCLYHGQPLCGFASGVPSTWPSGESWVSKADWPQTEEQLHELAMRVGMVCFTCDLKAKEPPDDR